MFSDLIKTSLVLAVGALLIFAPKMPAEERVEFVRDVMPALTKMGCNAGKCHGSFQGRGGFRLSLLGFQPEEDYESIVKQGRGRRLSLSSPNNSLLLRKPLGIVPHGGGKRFSKSDPAFTAIANWIRQGASPPAKMVVERIVVQPSELVLKPNGQNAIRVQAVWSDGISRDVSSWAVYKVREDRYADVDGAGKITANSPGRTAVTVSFMGQVAAVTVTVPYAPTVADKNSLDIDAPTENFIDEILVNEWRKMGLRPAPLADDYEFVRRAYLDIIGTLPTPAEVRRFAASAEPEKRGKLIDDLLRRTEYVDYWASKWADLLRVHRRYIGEKGLWTFWDWVRRSMRENWPVDKLTRELLTSRGSLFTNGATAYYFVDEKPDELAETTSQLFLGIRIQCAKCHHHPYEVWSQEDYFGLANCFTRLELKDNKDAGRYGGAKLLRPIRTVSRDRRVSIKMPPRILGHAIDPEKTDDVREEMAAWITRPGNPYFDRNFVNRYWSYFMGRGLVEPVDDLRATNPPSIPVLLDALEKHFVENGRDLKQLIRTICNSRVYQLASDPTPEHDPDGVFYTHRQFRRPPAAVMLDAVNQVTDATEDFKGLPRGTRAISLPDPAIPSYFLTAFGRSVRNSPCECATSNAPNLVQALHMINSDTIDAKITASGGRMARLLKSNQSVSAIVDELYHAALSRPATPTELRRAGELVAKSPSREEGLHDIMWTLLNSTEFVFNH